MKISLEVMGSQALWYTQMWTWGKNNGRVRSWGTSSQHFGSKRACWSSEMGTRKSDKHQLLTWTCTNQTTSWLVCSLSVFSAWKSHGQWWIHKIHHVPNLEEATTFPFMVDFVHGHTTNTQMSFCPRIPKWESWNSQSWDFCDFGGH
jgi:hypothetical protein